MMDSRGAARPDATASAAGGSADRSRATPPDAPAGASLLLGLLGFATLLTVFGWGLHEASRSQVYAEAGKTLEAISELKVKQILDWRSELLTDAGLFEETPLLRRVRQGAGPMPERTRRDLLDWMAALRRRPSYVAVAMVDREGAILLSDPPGWGAEPRSATWSERLAEALRDGRPRLSPPERTAEGKAVLDAIAPMHGSESALVVRVDLDQTLLPMLEIWPSRSPTGETLLVRREMDNLLYINRLRHRRGAPLTVRLDLANLQLPAARAVKGEAGLITGVDYREAPVLASLSQIPGTRWSLVTKVDTQEVEAPLRRQNTILLAAALFLLAAAAGGAWTILLRQRAAYFRQQYENESARRALFEHYGNLVRLANDVILLSEGGHRIIEANQRAEETYGYTQEELRRLEIRDLRAPESPEAFTALLGQIAEHGLDGMMFPARHRRKDGSTFPVEVSARIFESGGKRYCQSIIRDITARRQAEEALHQSQERLRMALEAGRHGVWEWDLADGRVEADARCLEILGLGEQPENLIAWMRAAPPPADREGVERAIGDLLAGRQPYAQMEYRIRRGDEEERWILESCQVTARDTDGAPIRVGGTLKDIDERKRAELRLRRLSRLYAVLLKISKAVVRARDREELFREICRIAVEDGGFALAWIGLVDPDTLAFVPVAWSGDLPEVAFRGGVTVRDDASGHGTMGTAYRQDRICISNDAANDPRMEHWRADLASRHYGSAASVPLHTEGRVIGVLQFMSLDPGVFGEEETGLLEQVAEDVSYALDRLDQERRLVRALSALRTSDDRFRIAVNSAALSLYETGRDLRITWTHNPSFALCPDDILGRTPGEIAGDAGCGVAERMQRVLETGAGIREEMPVALRGEHRWFDLVIEPRNGSDGDPAGLLVAAWDITQRKQAEQQLAASERRCRAIFEQANDAVILMDGGAIVDCNPAATRMLGRKREELLNRRPAEFSAAQEEPDPGGREMERLIARAADGEQQFFPWTASHHDGHAVEVEVNLSPLNIDGRPMCMGILRDVTERRKLENALARSQKLEAIGRLAGGVAHDMNNLLTIINGYSQILLNRLAAGDPMREPIREIREAGGRGENLTRQLLAFSRRQQVDLRVLDLNGIIAELESMLRRLIGADVALETRLDPSAGCVRADRGQLEQILMNLAVNARDAMPEGGRLVIETGREHVSSAGERATLAPGEYVRLSVIDTGCGMDEATRARIFEPFFTTKEEGKGTGLGLAITYGIARQSGGDVLVDSAPGQGSTFSIYLPRLDTAEVELEAAEAPAPAAAVGKTILLVEDEEAVRKVTQIALEEAGYRVLAAETPYNALEISDRAQPPIDLLLTDIVMPQISGPELARRIREVRPGLKALFMTGFMKGGFGAEPGPGAEILSKPFTPAELVARVAAVMAAPARSARVLVVDDEASVRRFLREVLESAGYQVQEAGDGRAAVHVLEREPVDLLITDLVMPEQEGLETVRSLRAGGRKLKIIAMSGAAAGYLRVAKILGADETLPKPASGTEILAAVERVLSD